MVRVEREQDDEKLAAGLLLPFPCVLVVLDVAVIHFEVPGARGAGRVREKLCQRRTLLRASGLCSSGSAGGNRSILHHEAESL